MEVDDSDDEDITIQSHTTTSKRKKTGVCIAVIPLPAAESGVLVPPPGGETPGKRVRLESNNPSGSNGPPLTTKSQTQVVPATATDPSKKPVRGLT